MRFSYTQELGGGQAICPDNAAARSLQGVSESGVRKELGCRWPAGTVVFAVLAVFFAMLSATTAQRVKQLARELEETRKRLREADASNASQSNGTLP
jgi:hypothetical protein